MTNVSNRLIKTVQNYLPSPFSIAILLTLTTLVIAFTITENPQPNQFYGILLLEYWQSGFWNLLQFGMQMVLMLILGYVLAISKPIVKLISFFTQFITNTSIAATITAMLTLFMSFFNWGLGLIFGAIFVRKVGDYCLENNIKINYALVGASGYSGLMVWHGGISGSAPLIVAEEDHFLASQIGTIGFDKTVFSTMNIFASFSVFITISALVYFLGKKKHHFVIPRKDTVKNSKELNVKNIQKIDNSNFFGMSVGLIILLLSVKTAFNHSDFKFITPNYINFLLLGLALLFHRNVKSFINATEEAINSSTGIIIQFPIYAGIMGIMKSSGLVIVISNFFVTHSSSVTFPLFTFFSAGLINIFIPSGGGQWAIQGPIIVEACTILNVPIEKGIMALAYGDQLTNMLQPFWALPLLGITKLKAHQILPYSFLIMIVGVIIFSFSLLFF